MPEFDGVVVAYCGNFQHAHCTEVHVAATLEALGVEVIRLQESDVTLDEMLARSADVDVFLYTRTWGLPGPQAIGMLRSLERRGVITASFHLDLYVGLNREHTLDGDPFWSTQWVFTPDGDPASEEMFAARGIRHIWSPPAVYEPECVMGEIDPRFDHDVVFVGSYPYPHVEWPYRNQLIEWLQHTYGAAFHRYGTGATTIRNMPLNDLYRTAKVVVGDSLCPGFTKPRYWSDRITETLGRGGALVWPRIDGIEDEGFVDCEHLRLYDFGNFDQLRTIINDMLDHPDETRAMAERGQAFVRSHHTYIQRMTSMLTAVGINPRET